MMTLPEEIKYCLKGGEKMKTLSDYLYGLGILKPDNKLHRIIRRALLFAVLAAIGQAIVGAPELISPLYLPVVLGILGALDKLVREKI